MVFIVIESQSQTRKNPFSSFSGIKKLKSGKKRGKYNRRISIREKTIPMTYLQDRRGEQEFGTEEAYTRINYTNKKIYTMEIKLRLEKPADYRETENITREAFWNHYSPGCNEHYLLHVMRDSRAFLPELDFVAVDDDRIVGNIVYLKGIIEGDDGKEYEVLSLGPISVLPEYQSKGIGSKLIQHTKEIARKMGFRAILLCGDPDYYSRQGFLPAEQSGIRTADNMYAAALQVCELYENALPDGKGRYIEDTTYEIDESAATDFDKNFPIKEKISSTPSQQRFEEIVILRKNAL